MRIDLNMFDHQDNEDDSTTTAFTSSLNGSRSTMSREQRKKMRDKRRSKGNSRGSGERNDPSGIGLTASSMIDNETEERHLALLRRNEDELLLFVANVNRVYQKLLKRDAPFMTFVFCGMQSAGKSTIMERFLNSVLNIVQQGTGTRCPLDATCIHDSTCDNAVCELHGNELSEADHGDDLTVNDVFQRITTHNQKLAQEDSFSTEPLHLIFKSSKVQNMRFVDTPGIISNQSTGKDNREDIKTILRSEMRKPNTKLCVLLEPKEFATNPILDFCDDSLGGRQKWIHDATFLMTKFDKQLDDARTATKANDFFDEFFENNCRPHLIITPTLDREDLPPGILFEKRTKLIESADEHEKDRFMQWQEGHERFRSENDSDERPLHNDVQKKIGFPSAKKVMREIMLKDTIDRLPEVIESLRNDLKKCNDEYNILIAKEKFNDPKNLRNVVTRMLYEIQQRMLDYLDGDLELSLKFPGKLMTLEDELEEEEESEWSTKQLNHHSEKENHWRDRISRLDEFPVEIQADLMFLGGKQYQRALEFFRFIMIDALPDPFQLRALVANVTGFLSGGLQHENWERAIVEITRVCLKDVSHPGLNYVIKHVGGIFRRLFSIALEDVKQGEKFSAEFKQIPTGVERFLQSEFDDMLWNLLCNASREVHSSMEPMYSTVDPNLPTFRCERIINNDQKNLFVKRGEEDFVSVDQDTKEQKERSWMTSAKDKMLSMLGTTSNNSARAFLKDENRKRAITKKSFLPDERAAMITEEETDLILQRSFEYIVALMEFNLHVFRFQLNYHLFKGFKDSIKGTLMTKINDADWDELVRPDDTLNDRLEVLEEQRTGLQESLDEVLRMQRNI